MRGQPKQRVGTGEQSQNQRRRCHRGSEESFSNKKTFKGPLKANFERFLEGFHISNIYKKKGAFQKGMWGLRVKNVQGDPSVQIFVEFYRTL